MHVIAQLQNARPRRSAHDTATGMRRPARARFHVTSPATRRLTSVVASASLFAGVVPAAASACTLANAPTARVFAALGDDASYSLIPGGSFETGAPGWTLSDATIINGNESYYLNSRSDSRSLAINAGGTAISTPVCVGASMPTFRFFAREINSTSARLTVNLLWKDAHGVQHATTVGTITDRDNGWTPTNALALGTAVPLTQPNGTQTVRIQFLPDQRDGDWAIDDVYADPYSKGLAVASTS